MHFPQRTLSLAAKKRRVEFGSPANFNCPGQIVVSGEVAAVDKCCELAKEKGAKRALKLPVSAPFHCAMLIGAGEKLAKELENVEVKDMQIPVITNVTADYVSSKEDIKTALIKAKYLHLLNGKKLSEE